MTSEQDKPHAEPTPIPRRRLIPGILGIFGARVVSSDEVKIIPQKNKAPTSISGNQDLSIENTQQK